MPNISPELLKEAFIDPIRFALVLDDEFPTYAQMSIREEARNYDYAKAGSLFSFCRSQGWLCDVDNAVVVAETFERDKHLNQSDLLVLDFHLESNKPEDPTKALGVLQSLASSNHFNLVIVYTAATPADVARDIAFSLGAGCTLTPAQREAVEDFFYSLDDQDSREISSACNVDIVQNFLCSKKPGASSNNLKQMLLAKEIDKPLLHSAVNYLCEEYLLSVLPREVSDARRAGSKVEASFDTEKPMWVAEGNLFAVIVNKAEPVTVLVDHLQNALVSWNPSPLRVLMVHARAALEKVGTNVDAKVLDTPRRQAGWLLRVLLATSDATRKRYTQELYGRLFERLIRLVDERVMGFGVRLFPPSDTPAVRLASEMAGANGTSDEHIYHALNEHLCSDSYTQGAITTGVIFRASKGTVTNYWLCASPACDLVPGQNNLGWDGELHPYRPINAVRLTPVNGLRKRLEGATQGRDIFIFVDDTALVLEVADDVTRKMKMETLFLAGDGVINASRFFGFIVGKGEDDNPSMLSTEFESIALLRSDYANKFLAESGHQRSRIGVDFVNISRG
ncbi:response regulator receiver domain [Pseudomonas frederiksbergensis]|uniref:response regulator receiver domain n=1 Tax=Pseudomonas frederiksbergensis TaxID=104087 RepID=UPI003D1F828B